MDVDVLVVGSVNRDVILTVQRLPLPGETVMAHRTHVTGGGKGANQAVAVAAAGARVAIVGAVGEDDAGRGLRAELEEAGVDVRELKVVVGVSSGSAFICVDELGQNSIVVDAGANAYASFDPFREDLSAAVVLAQAEIPVGVVAAAARFAAAQGSRFVFNAAPAPQALDRIPPGADPLVVNEFEAAELVGEDGGDPAELGRRLLIEARARSVIITLGVAGSLVVTPDGSTHVPAVEATEVIDTTGAGDTFVGALAARLARPGSLVEAARAGAAAAALSVGWRGARPPLLTSLLFPRT